MEEHMTQDDFIFDIITDHQYFFISAHDQQSKNNQIISCVYFSPLFKPLVLPGFFPCLCL